MTLQNPLSPVLALSALLVGCVDYGIHGTKTPEGSPAEEPLPVGDTGELPEDEHDTGEVPDEDVPLQVLPDDPARLEFPEDEPEPDPCAGELQTRRLNVSFPAVQGCGWERGDNLSALDARVRAVETEVVDLALPEGVEVCDVRFEFARSEGGMGFSLQYDDQLLLTLNERIVFSTDRRLVESQAVDADELYLFDWETVRDMEMDFHPEPWAMGAGYDLDMPPHDTLGAAYIAIDDAALSTLRTAATEELTFSLHAFGDNDETDCGHTGVGFWVDLDVPVY